MRKFFIYLLCLNLSLFPAFQVHAFVGVVPVALSNPVVRFVATEILIDVAAKGFAASDPLYNTSAKLSKAKYISFLRGKGKAIAFIAAGLAAVGFTIGDDITKPAVSTQNNDVKPVKGVAWTAAGRYDISPSALGTQLCQASYGCNNVRIDLYANEPNRSDLRNLVFLNVTNIELQSQLASSLPCQYVSGSVASCSADYVPPAVADRPATDEEIDSKFFTWISSQPEHDQRFAFAGDDGRLHPDIAKELEVSAPPLMPNGQALPAVGTQPWVYADMIARGVGQQTNADAPNYIPPTSWADASYLAQNVAAGNQAITSSNANGTPLPGEAVSPGTSFPEEIAVNNLGGIESRIDATNKLLTELSQTTVEVATAPDMNKSKSYWTSKYPDSFSGVWTVFHEKVQITPLFSWLNSFKIQFSGGASYPSWSFCTELGFVDFGCHDLTISPTVWTAVRSMMIFCASLLARRLVFGG
ncbi:hypothetical protein [Aeromonas caviae]|uniref:hypothetical protein n=1 Tax=Aeromonas caviae TaxID=648 RepID=UPI001CC60551|nr:hypothetical protein [Aeromonas caviae]GJA49218.1 hypothetical protein KAM347_10090 [Aeromonas caviae]GJA58097.1 hypothetical protein KAM350_10900 [Aeromonas caviae]GJA66520.1 hypothetical protein KAM352_04960 [Aeromonas caviae]GJB95716.1 hypothetical protein KAM383_12960 [Aeromonas caviae]